MPCTRPRSPLVTPDVQISRIRRTQILLAAGLHKELTAAVKRPQAQVGQLLIPGSSFRRMEGPLAPPAQMPDQTLPNMLGPQVFLKTLQKAHDPLVGGFDLLESHSIDARCALIGTHQRPSRRQLVPPTDPLVQSLKPYLRLLLALLATLLPPTSDIRP